LYDGAEIANVRLVARKFIRSRDLALSSDSSEPAVGVTAADELFFNLDGRIVSTTEDAWRLEVCGVHSSGTQHWVQLNVHGAIGCGLTLRTENLDAGQLISRVGAWLNAALIGDEPSSCPIVH
jgi:hypothetical protein